jgi:signal transduction histidine kinase
MTEEFVQQKLFRPFQSTKERGLGIGLYQCRHIVHALGGSLTAESQEGKGTRMVVKLPTEAISIQQSAVNT